MARAVLKTSQGEITLRFLPDKAPGHVKNFLELARAGFYDGTLFHRVIPGFMIQGGDPNTKDPAKAPSYGMGGHTDAAGRPRNLRAEFNSTSHRRGIVSMARAQDPDSASSQFFIVVGDASFLDNKYTAFAEVVTGMDVADRIVTASQVDRAEAQSGRGRPRNYQKLESVEVVEEPAA